MDYTPLDYAQGKDPQLTRGVQVRATWGTGPGSGQGTQPDESGYATSAEFWGQGQGQVTQVWAGHGWVELKYKNKF